MARENWPIGPKPPSRATRHNGSREPRYPLQWLFLGAVVVVGVELVTPGFLNPVVANPLTVKLPFFAALTMGRMTIAYALSLAFALAYGITAALNHRASHVLLPLLDILQSVPVLAVLPVVFILFLDKPFGEEVSSIILIFTAMVWAPTYGVIAGVNAIPADIKEASRAYGIVGAKYLRHIVLPAVFPELVWTSILAWGGGWYLIPVEEYILFLQKPHQLDGIGFYIAEAASRSDLASSVFGVFVLVGIIIAIDKLVWRPLERRADKYKYETVTSSKTPTRHPSRTLGGVRRAEGRLVTPILSFLKYERAYLTSFLESVHLRPRLRLSDRMRLHERLAKHILWGKIISLAIFATLVVSAVTLLTNNLLSIGQALAVLNADPGLLTITYYTGRSLLRIFTAYLMALGWTLGAGILIARSERASRLLVPLFDIGQSIPATALFPIIILLLVKPFPANSLALEVASVLLMLTGMQWYLLFNIVGGIHSIPNDILEASAAYRIRGLRFAREILIPASLPAIIIGSIQAWGGGWNATIVSEYITVAGQTGPASYHVDGLGYLLNYATQLPDLSKTAVILAATIITMTATILVINRFVWRRLLKKAERFKFEA